MTARDLQHVQRSSLCRCVTSSLDGMTRYAMPGCIRCLGKGVKIADREKKLAKNERRKIPTAEDFFAFDGAHCKTLYASLPANWQCPGCRRNKYQILRWTLRFPNLSNSFEGWAGGYHTHHDHGASIGSYHGRFAATVMCEQCNAADATAKRKLKLPQDFSFLPTEIASFVLSTPHGWHLLDFDQAAEIYRSLQGRAKIKFW